MLLHWLASYQLNFAWWLVGACMPAKYSKPSPIKNPNFFSNFFQKIPQKNTISRDCSPKNKFHWPALDRHGLGDVRQLRPRDAHHDPQDRHPACWQAQPTPRTDHLPDQSAPFRRAPARRWGAADCLRVRRPIAGFAADSSDG